MAQLGQYNSLKIIKEVDFGLYLDGEKDGEILLPKRYKPEKFDIGDVITVFIYTDSEDRIIATTLKPYAVCGEFAHLKVLSVSDFGAFLDWGLPKDLFVPFREQTQEMEVNSIYTVFVYIDPDSKRIMASSKIDRFVDNIPPKYEAGQEVDLIITSKTALGFKAIINNVHSGILYSNEVFQDLQKGQKIKGFIKKVREDDKIDLSLYKPGYNRVDDELSKIIEMLKENNSFLGVNDKTSSDTIYKVFGISKKVFKKAIGALYKSKVIAIEEEGIRLLKND